MNTISHLANEVKKIGFQINDDKTNIIELLESNENLRELEQLAYEKVNNFKYLGAILSTKNEWAKEIGIQMFKAKIEYFTLAKSLDPNC